MTMPTSPDIGLTEILNQAIAQREIPRGGRGRRRWRTGSLAVHRGHGRRQRGQSPTVSGFDPV